MYDVVLPGVTGRDELSVLCSRGGNSVCVMRCCRELLDAIGRRQPWDSRSLQQTDFRRSLSFLDLVGLGEYMTLYHPPPIPTPSQNSSSLNVLSLPYRYYRHHYCQHHHH